MSRSTMDARRRAGTDRPRGLANPWTPAVTDASTRHVGPLTLDGSLTPGSSSRSEAGVVLSLLPVAIGLAIAGLIVAVGANGPTRYADRRASSWRCGPPPACRSGSGGARTGSGRSCSPVRSPRSAVPRGGAGGECGHDQRPRRCRVATHARLLPRVRSSTCRSRLPDGRLTSAAPPARRGRRLRDRPRRRAALCTDLDTTMPAWPIVVLWAGAFGAGVRRYFRYRDRRGDRPSAHPVARLGDHRRCRGHPGR